MSRLNNLRLQVDHIGLIISTDMPYCNTDVKALVLMVWYFKEKQLN